MSESDAKKPEVENLMVEIMRDLYDGLNKEQSELTKTPKGSALWDQLEAEMEEDEGAVDVPSDFPDMSDVVYSPLVKPDQEKKN